MKRRRARSGQRPNKNDPALGSEIELTIDTIGAAGDGVGRFEGSPVYVPLALPGDELIGRLAARTWRRLCG